MSEEMVKWREISDPHPFGQCYELKTKYLKMSIACEKGDDTKWCGFGSWLADPINPMKANNLVEAKQEILKKARAYAKELKRTLSDEVIDVDS